MRLKTTCIFLLSGLLWLSGCSSYCKQLHDETTSIQDPTERGLMYVAISIIIAAIIRGFMNK